MEEGNVSAFLELIEPLGEKLVSAVWKTLELARRLGLYPYVHAVALQQRAVQQLTNLLDTLFIVDKQPPRLITGSESFSTSARLLVGQSLDIHLQTPIVGVSVLNEAQAKFLFFGAMAPCNRRNRKCFTAMWANTIEQRWGILMYLRAHEHHKNATLLADRNAGETGRV